MRILAIESSGSTGSVAALADGDPLSQLALDPAQRSARTLAPSIAQLLRQVGWKPRDVEVVAVGIGPGSFTGLRLGVMTAKAFAYAAGAKILGIGTLETIASRAPSSAANLAVAVDAQRGEVYRGNFTRNSSGELHPHGAVTIATVEHWLDSLTAAMTATGPALAKLHVRLPSSVAVAPPETWLPTAAAVGMLAARREARGAADDLWTLAPCYLRRSAAEEKWDLRAT